jgi:hypothetical protein
MYDGATTMEGEKGRKREKKGEERKGNEKKGKENKDYAVHNTLPASAGQ